MANFIDTIDYNDILRAVHGAVSPVGVSARLIERLSREWPAIVGTILVAAGGVYAASLVLTWINSGFGSLPFALESLLAFTAIVLGIQTVFSAFFISAIGSSRPS